VSSSLGATVLAPAGQGLSVSASASATVLAATLRRVSIQQYRILEDIDLTFRRARWTAIVGPNGAGKSTLLRVLAGLQRCEGEVRLQDRPITDWRPRARARELSWMGQHEGGSDDLSAQDVVMLGRLPHQPWLGAPGQVDRDAVHWAMTQTQSWDWRDRPLNTLSGGERQRVLLSRVLAVRARVLLMDEPLTHLDPPHQADWLGIVRAQVAEGVTVVSVLHELNMALQADDLVVMSGGRVVHQGPPSDASTHAALQRVFDNRLRLVCADGQWVALPDIVPTPR
jgi:iron complex transport system ATP-binding protein